MTRFSQLLTFSLPSPIPRNPHPLGGVSALVKRLLFLVLLMIALPIAAAPPSLVIDRAKGEVRIRAIVQPRAMQRWFGVQGHHAVVWNEGKASRWALFRAFASDHDVRVALEALDAKPGENLTIETWTERSNPKSLEPDKRVEGTPVEVFVSWGGRAPVPLASVLRQEGSPSPELEFRYGGNEKWQPTFKSGCIVCLYSCPGGAVSSRSHTIRDYEKEGVIYFSRPEALPPDGTEITIILRPKRETP